MDDNIINSHVYISPVFTAMKTNQERVTNQETCPPPRIFIVEPNRGMISSSSKLPTHTLTRATIFSLIILQHYQDLCITNLESEVLIKRICKHDLDKNSWIRPLF